MSMLQVDQMAAAGQTSSCPSRKGRYTAHVFPLDMVIACPLRTGRIRDLLMGMAVMEEGEEVNC